MITAPRLQHVSSGGLALAVHALFVAALVLSMSWKTLPHLPVEADLWAALPEPLPLEMPPPPPPEPAPPVAAPAPPQPAPADIALRKAEEDKKRHEQELRRQEEARRQDELRQAEERRLAEEKAQERARQEREDMERAEKERIEKLKRELARRQMEQDMARQAQAEMEADAAQARVLQAQNARRARLVEDYRQRIQAKILSNVRLPQRISGNPEAIFKVTLFANGEVREVKLLKSSDMPAYDVEVERAILKASPLPLPNEKEAAAAFREGLALHFRPYANGSGAGP